MDRSFARALRFRWLTPFYDLLADTLFRLDARKQRLVELTAGCGEALLVDVGGGTGTLARLLLRADPRCRVVVIDLDLAMLLRARRRVARRGWLVAASRAAALAHRGCRLHASRRAGGRADAFRSARVQPRAALLGGCPVTSRRSTSRWRALDYTRHVSAETFQ